MDVDEESPGTNSSTNKLDMRTWDTMTYSGVLSANVGTLTHPRDPPTSHNAAPTRAPETG